jgi:hypothetical protein
LPITSLLKSLSNGNRELLLIGPGLQREKCVDGDAEHGGVTLFSALAESRNLHISMLHTTAERGRE